MKTKIIPTIFSNSNKDFSILLQNYSKLFKQIQIDICDGKFVKFKSIGFKSLIQLKKHPQVYFEAHLMVSHPNKYFKILNELGFKKIIVHFESFKGLTKLSEFIDLCFKKNISCWVAFNPNIHLKDIYTIIQMNKCSGVMFMGHVPGFQKVDLDGKVLNKILKIRKRYPKLDIQIDGGVNENTIKKIFNSGVNLFSVGSFISQSSNPLQKYRILKSLI